MRTTIVDGRDAVVQNAPVRYRVTFWHGDMGSLASTEIDIEDGSLWEVFAYIHEYDAADLARVEIAVVHPMGDHGAVETQLLGVVEEPSLRRQINIGSPTPSDFDQRPGFILSTADFAAR